jgi:hypothetical protein
MHLHCDVSDLVRCAVTFALETPAPDQMQLCICLQRFLIGLNATHHSGRDGAGESFVAGRCRRSRLAFAKLKPALLMT